MPKHLVIRTYTASVRNQSQVEDDLDALYDVCERTGNPDHAYFEDVCEQSLFSGQHPSFRYYYNCTWLPHRRPRCGISGST
jgi:hypothetical protein